MSIRKQLASARITRNPHSLRVFFPTATVKCDGVKTYRSQTARDVACLLDIDPQVVSWHCMPMPLPGLDHVPDFEVVDEDGCVNFIDAPDRPIAPHQTTIVEAARGLGAVYRVMPRTEIYRGFRLRNAVDLLRYGNVIVPLGDRLRLLAALDEHGSLAMGECLKAFQETRPVAGLASLILQQYVEVDFDAGPFGPETSVRRITR
ncbi:UNVERIFIED_ORG: hypothetical protein GGD48_000869 [Rhizobium etli]